MKKLKQSLEILIELRIAYIEQLSQLDSCFFCVHFEPETIYFQKEVGDELRRIQRQGSRKEQMDTTQQYRRFIEENISLDILKERYPHEVAFLDEIAAIILDVVCSDRDKILVGREKKPMNLVKSQFLKLNSMHIEYVLECMNQNTTEI